MPQASLQEKCLLEAIVKGEASHALLLSGSDRKALVVCAEAAAKAMLCERPNAKGACLSCHACRLFDDRNHPDYCFLDKGKERGIKVETVRDKVIADLVLRPQYQNKVYVLLADDLNEQGQNALLKSLEEPPDYARFILVAAEPQQLLETVHSRLQHHTISTRKQAKAELNPRLIKLFFAMPKLSIADVLCEGLDLFLEEKDFIVEILERYQSYLRDLAWLLQGGSQDEEELLNPEVRAELIALSGTWMASGQSEKARSMLFSLSERTNELQKAFAVNASYEVSCGQYLMALNRGFLLDDLP